MVLKKPFLPLFLPACIFVLCACEDYYDNVDEDSYGEQNFYPQAAVVGAYQAENHTFQSGCSVRSNHSGYTGSGFMDYGGNGTLVEWNNVKAPAAGQFTLVFRYSNGSAGDRPCAVAINDTATAGDVTFAKTGAWNTWATASIKVTLKQGMNKVRVTANTTRGGPNVDKMDVTSEDTAGGTGTDGRCAVVKEGSTANLSCPSGQVIGSITFASYGTPTGSCPSFAASSCHAQSSADKVKAACLNKSSCSVPAGNTLFGDPCPGKFKKLAVLFSCSSVHRDPVVPKDFDKPVFVHYMPWFDSPEFNGSWGWHWTMNVRNPNIVADAKTGRRQIAAHYHPLIGPYDSQDPDVIEYHLLLMKYSGVDGILINWYGEIGTNGDVRSLLVNSNAIVERSAGLGMSFSVIMEDRFAGSGNGLSPVDYVHTNIAYLRDHYFPKNNFIRFQGKPVFGIFGPITVSGEANWSYAMGAAREETVFLTLPHKLSSVGAAADGVYDWVFAGGLASTRGFYQNQAKNVSFAMGGAYPGFHDYYSDAGVQNSYFFLDHKNGNLLRQTLDLAWEFKDNIEALQLITWNDFGEGTILEPTLEFGYSFLTILQEKLGVPYGEAELRAIHRLYTLRKQRAGNPSAQAVLDQAREHLVALRPARAVELMDTLGQSH